jgi:hypothetical protein
VSAATATLHAKIDRTRIMRTAPVILPNVSNRRNQHISVKGTCWQANTSLLGETFSFSRTVAV